MSSPLNPPVSLLVKLGSIAVHADELLSEKRHSLDIDAMRTLIEDEDVVKWLKEMTSMALVPVKR